MVKEEMSERFLDFAAGIINLGKKMNKTFEGQHVYKQLFRSGTSSGANYAESHSAQSTKDFVHKREIALKELQESLFWLKLVERSHLVNEKDSTLILLLKENEELIKIIAKSIATTKKNKLKLHNKLTV